MYNNAAMPHATIPLPKSDVHPKHPFKNAASHQALLDYVQPRLAKGRDARDARLNRMVKVDKSMAGWMRLSDDERKQALKQDRTGIPTALTVNLPLNYVQIDDMMTYYSTTFSPNRGMFYQMGKPQEKAASNQIVTIMNNHAIYAGYYRQVLLSVLSTLKYNLGGFYSYWSQDIGPKLSVDPTTQSKSVEYTKIWEGNKVESLDMYNTFLDPSVTPSELYREGEYCARAMLKSHYWLQKKASEGLYFNCEDALENDTGVAALTYYKNPPQEAMLIHGTGEDQGSNTNWTAYLGGTPSYLTDSGFELVEIFIKLNPVELNLIPATNNKARNRYEIWRLTLLNDMTFIDITPMTNIHGFLPFFMGAINDDSMGTGQKSPAEIIQPLQDFASFLLNMHVRATRKNIWGLTIFDKSIVDLDQIPDGEVSARVAAKATAAGKDMTKAIHHADNNLDTKQTMQDLEAVMAIIEKFFPTTSMPSQIANIDRAVDSQVAAVQQGANRRMQKGARLLDDTMFRPLRFCLYYNIIQFQPDGASITDFYGAEQKVDLTELKSTDLPFIIGQGLKAIDRQAAAGQMQNIIFAIIQNPAAAQRVDIMAMIDYWTNMIDIDIDMTQFEIQQPQAPGGAAGIDPTTGQPIAGGPVAPITSPAAVTAPLTKSQTDGVGAQAG